MKHMYQRMCPNALVACAGQAWLIVNETSNLARGYKTFFMLKNVKMPTIAGILTFMSGKNSILGLSEPKKAEFLDIFLLMNI